MTKFFLLPLLAAMAATVTFSSCKDENDDGNFDAPKYVFSIDEEYKALTPPALGQEYTIAVTSTKNGSRIGFSVVEYPDWAPAVVDLTGLSINVEESLLRDPRPGKVVIKQEESEDLITVDISQVAVVDEVSVPESVESKTLQVVAIVPEIGGYDKLPQYKWTCDAMDGTDSLLCETRNLYFIPTLAKDYNVKFTIRDGNVTENKNITVKVTAPDEPYSRIIAKVFEYQPAPGWRVGPSVGTAADTKETVAEKCLATFQKNGETGSTSSISLGDFGGYMIFGFDHAVINKPGLRDFRITSSTGKGNNVRPAIILVSMDTNGNGLPDDEWYEIAGSEFMHVQTKHNVSMTYYKPSDDTSATPKPGDDYLHWVSSWGKEGWIPYKQISNAIPVYPMWYTNYPALAESITFEGLTQIPTTIVMNGMFPDQSSDANYKPYAYGYACNQPNSNEKGTSIDIGWAIGKDNNYVHLAAINFVKVYTATFVDRGSFYGEADADITQAFDLHLMGKEIESAE